VVGTPQGLIAQARRAAGVAAVALACAAGTTLASDEALHITGQCREGHAQGGYALHSPDGRLRVQGAFNQGQRVGSFIFWTAAGVRVAHLPFDSDVLAGTVSLWYAEAASGAESPRRLEAVYRQGQRHGQTRSWYASGNARAEYEYADGTLRGARAWTESGAPYDDAAARALAERDRAADADYLDTLLTIVRRHLPDCTPPPPQQRAALEYEEEGAL
jgi:hypothetical protein